MFTWLWKYNWLNLGSGPRRAQSFHRFSSHPAGKASPQRPLCRFLPLHMGNCQSESSRKRTASPRIPGLSQEYPLVNKGQVQEVTPLCSTQGPWSLSFLLLCQAEAVRLVSRPSTLHSFQKKRDCCRTITSALWGSGTLAGGSLRVEERWHSGKIQSLVLGLWINKKDARVACTAVLTAHTFLFPQPLFRRCSQTWKYTLTLKQI